MEKIIKYIEKIDAENCVKLNSNMASEKEKREAQHVFNLLLIARQYNQ
jgi:hypothetical protein